MAATKVDPKFVAERQDAIKENIRRDLTIDYTVPNVKVAPPSPEPETEVVADSTTTEIEDSKTKKAGFMGLPTIAWVAIIGVGVYYAYSKGMFKKLLK